MPQKGSGTFSYISVVARPDLSAVEFVMPLNPGQAGKSKGGERKHGTGVKTTDGTALVPQEIAAPIGFFRVFAAARKATNRAVRRLMR
jgi:hypothetical protein